MRRAFIVATFVCTGGASSAAWAESAQENPQELRRNEVVFIEPNASPDVAHAESVSRIIYVNRCSGGCTITPGDNDSRLDTVSFIQETSVVSEFEHSETAFEQIISCVREVYAPYNVEIVTEDPGPNVAHHEAILAGRPQEIGMSTTVGGIAPAGCSPLDNAISFSFSNTGADPLTMCWTVAQESAHAFGLPDHVFDCSDPMTYIPGCGKKFFRDRDLPCGEFALNDPPCRCGAETQNSHQALLAVFGPGDDPPPPSVEVALPADGASVEDGFSIYAYAIDPRLVDRVELWINGSLYETRPGYEFDRAEQDYYWPAPEHADGYMTVEIRAYNDLEIQGSASVRVLKGAPCDSDDQCRKFQSCQEGACTYPPAEGTVGDGCEYDQYCTSALCVGDSGSRRCSQSCDPAAEESCPDGFSCLADGERGLCWPNGGGCCSVGGGLRGGDAALAAGVLLCLVGFARRRRRRS